jgi:predicted metal-binding membrane protein
MCAGAATQWRVLVGMLTIASIVGWILLPARGHAMPQSSLCGTMGAGLLNDWKLLVFELGMLSAKDAALWFAMLLAMAPPLVLGPLTRLKALSTPAVGWRDVLVFLVGYSAAWILAVPALIGLATELNLLGQRRAISPLMLGCAIALAWQATPLKRRALELCHRPPAVHGGNAHTARRTVWFGLVNGTGCAGSCWALMLIPMTVAGDGRLSMALITLVALVERRFSARRMARVCSGHRDTAVAHALSLQQR